MQEVSILIPLFSLINVDEKEQLSYLHTRSLASFLLRGRGKTASALPDGDTIPLRYAENLTLVSYPDYTLATLRNPWDTLHTLHTYILVPKDRELPAHLPEGTVVRTPLSKSVIYSSVHCVDG